MKTAALFLATAALVAAQQGDDYSVCKEDGQAFCAGASLATDIIIRCSGEGKGIAGRCSNNMAGNPPVGSYPSLCYQTSDEAGDAACEKNCVVYTDEPFTLPADVCTPFYTATSSVEPTSTSTATETETESEEPTATETGTETEEPTETDEPEPTGDATQTTVITSTVGPSGNGTCGACTPTPSGEPTTVPTGPAEAGAAGVRVGMAAMMGVVAWVL